MFRELGLMRQTEFGALAIGFGQRVGKPHHAARVGTVAESVRVTELVDGFRRHSTMD